MHWSAPVDARAAPSLWDNVLAIARRIAAANASSAAGARGSGRRPRARVEIKFSRHIQILNHLASTFTPSTRRVLGGVAMPVDGSIIVEK